MWLTVTSFIFSYLLYLHLIYFLKSPNIFESVLMTYRRMSVRMSKYVLLRADVIYRKIPPPPLAPNSQSL